MEKESKNNHITKGMADWQINTIDTLFTHNENHLNPIKAASVCQPVQTDLVRLYTSQKI